MGTPGGPELGADERRGADDVEQDDCHSLLDSVELGTGDEALVSRSLWQTGVAVQSPADVQVSVEQHTERHQEHRH